MKKEEVNKQIKEVVRPNGKGEINGNNLQETLLLMNNNAANDEDTTSKLNLKANQEETDEKLALKADKTSVYTKEEANALLDLKVNIKDYESDKEVSNKEKQELDIKLTQTKQELDSVKNSLSHMGNGVVGEAKGSSVINLPNNAMKSVIPNYKIKGFTDVEGTKSVQLPMRVKSTGVNLFDMSAFGWESAKKTKVKQISDTELEVWNDDFYSWAATSKPVKNLKEGNKYYVYMRMKLISEKGTANAFLYTDNERVILSSDKFIEFIAGKNNSLKLGATDGENVGKARFSDIIISDDKNTFERYKESNLYLNNNLELKSVGKVSDYTENGKLYKNISDEGEILEETEVVNLSTSGLIEANPNGTVFFEPITNITGFYDNGLDVEGLDILEVEEFSHLINGVYQSLDVSKVKVEGGKLTHPDAQNGIVYLVYRYDNNAVWGENTISYYNSDKTLKSPNGKIWKKVESATDTGELVVTLEEVNIVEP